MATTSDRLTRARNLAEAVNGQPENVADALPRLVGILASETDSEVITEAVVALGFAGDPRAVQLILDHVRVDHPDAGVRLAVARALPDGFERDNPIRDAVIEALITLTADENWEVRDWACLGLGLVDADSPEARDALAARLTDLEGDIRHEALWALALTGDSRALARAACRWPRRSRSAPARPPRRCRARRPHTASHAVATGSGVGRRR